VYAASHIVTLARSGKTPRRQTKRVLCDDDGEAVFYAQQWVVWSQERPKKGRLPRWDVWRVERLDGRERVLVREGTLQDAAQEYGKQDVATATFRTVATKDILGPQERRTTGRRTGRGSNRPTSRLAAFAQRVLNDQ
jgi:hypothetical protein